MRAQQANAASARPPPAPAPAPVAPVPGPEVAAGGGPRRASLGLPPYQRRASAQGCQQQPEVTINLLAEDGAADLWGQGFGGARGGQGGWAGGVVVPAG